MTSPTRLKKPPIDEVVCGFVFEPLPLSSLDFGVYWDQRRADFPQHELQPPVLDGSSIRIGAVLDARVWLIGGNDELVLQLQHDRFYVNWRRRGDHYPRFSNYNGNIGLKQRALEEFAQFADFAEQRSGKRPAVVRLELTKIDILDCGIDYSDMRDLRALLPVTRVFEEVSLSDPQQLQLRLSEAEGETSTHIAVTLDTKRVRIEARHVFPFTGDLDANFVNANTRINRVFFGLVVTERFGTEGQ